MLVDMAEQARILHSIADEMEGSAGRGGHMLTVRNLALQLESMAQKPESVQLRLDEYRDNLSALGTWLLQTVEQPCRSTISSWPAPNRSCPGQSPPCGRQPAMNWPNLWQVSHTTTAPWAIWARRWAGDRSIKVWIGTGRDQAQALKTMIEDTFTPQTGIRVDLELVDMNILLQATLAGQGPDVALGVDPSQPMNYGSGCGLDLAAFPDFQEIADRFYPASLEPFTFRDWVFALPEQLPFFMLFYRQDILAELGIDVPQTWDEVLQVIPELQKLNMNFGLPWTEIKRNVGGRVGETPRG